MVRIERKSAWKQADSASTGKERFADYLDREEKGKKERKKEGREQQICFRTW